MNSLKTVFLAALMSAAAYGVYVTVHGPPADEASDDAPPEWQEPKVELPSDDNPKTADEPDSVATTLGGAAPAFDEGEAAATPQPESPEPPSDAEMHYSVDAERPPADPRLPDIEAPEHEARGEKAPAHETTNASESEAVPARYETEGVAQVGDSRREFEAAMRSAQDLLDGHQLSDALRVLTEWYQHPVLSPQDDVELTELLDQLAGTVIYSRQHLLDRPYVVQPGDTLERIADNYNVPWQLLAKINGVRDQKRLRQGEQLKVIQGPFDASIDLTRFQLTLFVQERYAGRFAIGIGQDRSTPEGDFAVLEKLVRPVYYGPDRTIDPSDPDYPLGPCALLLGDKLMIHGTNDPQSIGKAKSRGCIRLSDRDIADVFDILSAQSDRSQGSQVRIHR